jgi:hypothetical protein
MPDNEDNFLDLPEETQIKTQFSGFQEEERHKIRQAVKRFAYYKSKRVEMEHLRKVVRARKMNEAEERGIRSIQAQTKYAESHPEYSEIIKAYAQTVEQEALAYHELEMFKIDVEIWRTQQANKRSELSSYS